MLLSVGPILQKVSRSVGVSLLANTINTDVSVLLGLLNQYN